MDPCNGAKTSAETSAVSIDVSTTTTATNTTENPVSSDDDEDVQDEEVEDPNFDRLTQILPECFVSVKLESHEDTSPTETSAIPVCLQTAPFPKKEIGMQDSRQVEVVASSSDNRVVPSAHCFYPRGPMPELPPWLQHCYSTGQMQNCNRPQGGQHFHQPAAYIAHDGSIVQTDRSLKPNVGVATSSAEIGGLASGDVCDSNTFLSYVLNQQRSSGIFLFDPMRTLYPNDAATENSVTPQQSESATNTNSVSQQHPSAIPPSQGTPTRRDAATNTVSKYSVPLHADAKTKTEDCSDDSDTPSTTEQSKECNIHHCTKPAMTKSAHVCCEGASDSCQKTNHEKVKTEEVTTDCSQEEHACCHKPCTCTPDNTVAYAVNDSGISPDCNCVHYCGNSCIKDNRRLQYVDADRAFMCDICSKNCPTSTALMNHMRYHRGQRPYQCDICNKAFATNSHLITHRRVHTGEKPFQCRLCRRCFADRSAFVKHERTHGPNGTIIKRYKCEECGNSFMDSCGLKKHIRIHTGERPYCCTVCHKTFSTSSTYVAHKRIHSGERPYKCESCDKMFITKSHLLTHRRTHTGEKPFTCQVCNRSFADGSSFRRHERLHTGENRHTCDICGKGFPFDSSLAKHKQSHVPGTPTYVYMA